MNNDLILVQTSLAEFDAVEAGLIELEKKYKGVAYAVSTTKGMAEAVAARAEIRAPRVSVEKIRKAGKAPILSLGRLLDSKASEITTRLEDIEGPIHDQIKAEEKRKADEKAERDRIESERVARHQAVIDGIKSIPLTVAGQNSVAIQAAIDLLSQKDCSGLEEFTNFGENAKSETISKLTTLKADAVIKEQREAAEAAALKAEEDRLAAERKVLAEAQKALHKQWEETQEALRKERQEEQEALRKQREEARIKREAEEAELAKAREAIAAAEAKVEADRKALQEQQDLFLKQQEAKAVPVADAEDEKQATFLKTLGYQKPAERTPADEIVFLVKELLHDNEFMNYVEMFLRDDSGLENINPFETFENLAVAIKKYEATK
jgi:hypothetical protein